MSITTKQLSLDEIFRQRRSIRKYRDTRPQEEWLFKMLHVASLSPSPSNSQPVRFAWVHSNKARKNLQEAMSSGRAKFLTAIENKTGTKRIRNWINSYYRFSEFMFTAPEIFAVGIKKDIAGFSDKMIEAGLLSHYNDKESSLEISLGLALQSFLLKGSELGLGTCVMTAPLVFIPNIEEILGIDDLKIKCLVTVGFADELPGKLKKKDGLDILRKI